MKTPLFDLGLEKYWILAYLCSLQRLYLNSLYKMKTLFLHFHKAKWKQFGLFSGNIYPCLLMFNFRFRDIFKFLFLFQYRLYATTPTGLGTGQALENTSLRILTQPFAPMLFMVLLFWVLMASLNPMTVGLIWIMSFTRKLLL